MEEQPENSRRGNRDRLSALPDCLLHVIMSFLPIRQAIIMSRLSKRWKNLWTTLPVLKFDYNEYINELFEITGRGSISDGHVKFKEFVSMILLVREPCDLLEFQLHCSELNCSDYKSMISWILYALKHKPKVIHITVSSWDFIPVGFFKSPALEDVFLSVFSHQEPFIRVIDLPCLKQLRLQEMSLDQDFFKKLFCGCPVLESLHLGRCELPLTTIVSQSLKYLDVESYCGGTLEFVNTPNLLSFHYCSCPISIGHKTLLNMPSLTDAKICISGCHDQHSSEGKNNFFPGILNVQNLQLLGTGIKDILSSELPNCPEFPNLKYLFVANLCLNCDFDLLASFLDHCPNLEKLSVRDCGCDCWMSGEHENWELLEVAPFRCNQLKKVEVQFCKHDKNFPQVMKYLQDGVDNLRAGITMSTFPSDVVPYKSLCYHHRLLCSTAERDRRLRLMSRLNAEEEEEVRLQE